VSKLVDIGDGRIIEFVEPGEQSPEPIKKPRIKNPGSKPGRTKTTTPRYEKKGSPCGRKPGSGGTRDHIPGYREWLSLRATELAQFRNKPGFASWKRHGVPDGMRKQDAEKAWAEARRKAEIHMANLKKAGLLPDDELIVKATQATLEIMESPMNQDMKLKAARQLLEWYKPKPVAKSEVTVNAAEAWLASIAEETAKQG
jgi:hypothetical protein